MHQQHVARRHIDGEIFGAPPDTLDLLAFEPLDEVLRERPPQILAAGLDLLETRAFHGRREAATHGLNFGQFRHACSVSFRDVEGFLASDSRSRYGPATKGLFSMPRSGDRTHFGF